MLRHSHFQKEPHSAATKEQGRILSRRCPTRSVSTAVSNAEFPPQRSVFLRCAAGVP